MKIKQGIKRIFFISLWIVIGGGVTVLLIAAIRIKREKVCKGYKIEITNNTYGHWFIDKKTVEKLLTKNGRDTLNGKGIIHFDLKRMEALLEKNRWVRDAELFFDNKQILQVKITERVPIARIITSTGSGFYIDSSCARLPLSVKMATRLPVFTGFPSDKLKLKRSDRLLLEDIKEVSSYLLQEPFWMAQVAQIDITPGRNFEIIPTIGNHIIEFGNGSNCQEKFKRLLIFYMQVLSKAGMEKYTRINVQYDRQVIGVRNNYSTRADSLKLIKNVELLIASSQNIDFLKKDSGLIRN
jgi:cell division protein FtsQ